MPYLPSLGANAMVRDVARLNRPAGRALIVYHEAVMRQESPLSLAEREMIAALVSGLNACGYCHGVHAATAAAHGVDPAALVALIDDPTAASVDERLRPILAYVRKLTLTPARMVQADADAVFAAGWSEQALHDAINVACLFNFMNRLVDGHGVKGDDELYRARGRTLSEGGYAPMLAALAD